MTELFLKEIQKKVKLELQKRKKAFMIRTLGSYLFEIYPKENQPFQGGLERIRNRYTTRKMYVDEFELIWNKQSQFHVQLTDELKTLFGGRKLDGYKEDGILFHQRPLRSQKHLVGPLLHTIRVGLHDTARWLLANGADPRLRVRDAAEAPAGFPPPDALGVAVAAGAWNLVDTLLRQPAYASLSPRDKARALWPYALASATRTAGMFGRRVALPAFGDDPQLAGALLQHAL